MKVIATWDHGLPANACMLQVLGQGGSAMDAVVQAGMLTEISNGQRSVGLGGLPDRDGLVTLDAAVMGDDARAGSVAAVRGVAHPVQQIGRAHV